MTSPLDRVADLAAWLAAAGLDELELRGPEGQVRLVLAANSPRRHAEERPQAASRSTHERSACFETARAAPPQHDAVGSARSGSQVVTSPGVGHFLSAHPLRDEPLVRADEPVAAGQPLALLRVGALLLAVPAPRDGVVARVVAPEGALVGYGAPLVELWPEA